jgi:Zn-dependent protease with chaperone function
MKFKGTFYDGTSTRAYPCEVSVNSLHIKIELITDPALVITWEHQYIQRSDFNQKKLILKYGSEFPFQTLEVDSPDIFQELQNQVPDAPYLKSPYGFFEKHGLKSFAIGLSLIIGFLTFAYFFLIPWIVVGVAEIFPRNMETTLGRQLRENFIEKETIDSTKTIEINKFYSQLKVDTDYKINITVVKSDTKNAFALPGGEIVVFSAILDSMHTYGELAALLGHEVGHIQKRHTLKMLFKNLSTYIFISAMFQDFSGIMAIVIENASMVEQLSYNREVESESDDFGFDVLLKNKIDPHGMVDLFQQLMDDSHKEIEGKIPEFLMTHPKLDNRIETIKGKIAHTKYEVVPNDYLNSLLVKLKKP